MKTTCESSADSAKEHAMMAKMGKKPNTGKHFPPKFAGKGAAKKA